MYSRLRVSGQSNTNDEFGRIAAESHDTNFSRIAGNVVGKQVVIKKIDAVNHLLQRGDSARDDFPGAPVDNFASARVAGCAADNSTH